MITAASQTVGTSTPATAQRGRTYARRQTQPSLAPESGSFPCPGAIVDLLLAHRESQSVERQRAAQLWSEEGWIFADETGRAINPRTDWDGWKRLLAAAGVRDGRLHDARHTAATDLLLLGVHERTIMSVLGWSTTAMASRYTHVITPIHSDLASRLDGLLWSSRKAPMGTN